LAKCILSRYNTRNAYAISDILVPLDERYTRVVLAMVKEYAERGETEERLAEVDGSTIVTSP
jgi:hypothetical protein